ncbi:unnamed protein product [Gongylonema pulchrum]|uniref:TAXi_C domain-containing protein n=1 Tax=Gongylonema pulchrum TaxID=637853 RepID=A0A183CUV1_9BILA|nr:unnamed protein product [Gongylonema pulchrum]
MQKQLVIVSIAVPFEVVKSDLELFSKPQSNPHLPSLDPLVSLRVTNAYDEKKVKIPHSKLSRIKAHKLLGDIGKTRSANDIFYDKYKKRLRSPSPRDSLATTRSTCISIARSFRFILTADKFSMIAIRGGNSYDDYLAGNLVPLFISMSVMTRTELHLGPERVMPFIPLTNLTSVQYSLKVASVTQEQDRDEPLQQNTAFGDGNVYTYTLSDRLMTERKQANLNFTFLSMEVVTSFRALLA